MTRRALYLRQTSTRPGSYWRGTRTSGSEESSVPANAILTEDGFPILTEDGDFLLTET